MPRFSEHFGLNLSQAELDFVDIPLDTDLALFVDPFAISIGSDPWFHECEDTLVGFFTSLISLVTDSKRLDALRMLSHVGEANEAHLGYSQKKPAGSGIGPEKARNLYDNLSQSLAVRTGNLADISELDLFINGVAEDNISDLTISILRSHLLQYTKEQCVKYGVATSQVAAGACWNSTANLWESRYAELPIYNGSRLLLVPKAAVRYYLSLRPDQYYDKFVLNYLQAEHLSANSSLVQTLKNGKRRVTKHDLRKVTPHTKDYLARFSKEHPQVLKSYKEAATMSNRPLKDREIEDKQPRPLKIDYLALWSKLSAIPAGIEAATDYHRAMLGILQAVFNPGLRRFKVEEEINEGRKRIDILANNAGRGFFRDLFELHKIHSPFVPIECKNYKQDLKNPEFDQLSGRFSEQRGNFGILTCRETVDKRLSLARARDAFRDRKQFIFVMDDRDFELLLRFKALQNDRAIDDWLTERLYEIVR